MLLDPTIPYHEFYSILLKTMCARSLVAKILVLEVILKFYPSVLLKDNTKMTRHTTLIDICDCF